MFDSIDLIALRLQVANGIQRVRIILPFNGLFRTEGGLVNLLVGRATADTAKSHTGDAHGIGSTKYCSDVVLAPHVVEYDHQR